MKHDKRRSGTVLADIKIPLKITIEGRLVRMLRSHHILPLIGMVLIPIDSSPFFPLGSVNRPMWAIFFVMYAILEMGRRRTIKRSSLILSILLFFTLSYSLITHLFLEVTRNHFIKGGFVLTLSVLAFTGAVLFFEYLISKYGKEGMLRLISYLLIISSFIPMFLGSLQKLTQMGLFPGGITVRLTMLFSVRYTSINRIQMASGEPSWAANYLIFIMVFTFLFYDGKFKKLILFTYFVFLVFTNSTFGFLVFLMLVGVWIISRLNLVRIVKYFSLFLLFCGFFYLIVFPNLTPYTQAKFYVLGNLLLNFSFESVILIASRDWSFLARVINPVIALHKSIEILPFGHGIETFHVYVLDSYQQYGILSEATIAEKGSAYLGRGSTPKSLIAKIFFEGGLLFIIFLGVLYINTMRKLRNDRRMIMLMISIVIMTFSEDSYLFYGFLLISALLYTMYRLEGQTPEEPVPQVAHG